MKNVTVTQNVTPDVTISDVTVPNVTIPMITLTLEERKLQAEKFIALLTGSKDTPVYFVCGVHGNWKEKRLVGTLEKHWRSLVELNDAGYGIYVTVQATNKGRTVNHATHLRALFAECDEITTAVYHKNPTMIIESSPGKEHLYWVLNEPLQLDPDVKVRKEQFNEWIVPYIDYYESDVACKDLARILRVPGFFNTKAKYKREDGSYPLVKLTDADGCKYNLDDILIPKVTLETVLKDSPGKKGTNVGLPTPSSSSQGEAVAKITGMLESISSLKRGEINSGLNKLVFSIAGLAANLEDGEKYLDEIYQRVDYEVENETWDDIPQTKETVDRAWHEGFQKPMSPISATTPDNKLSRRAYMRELLLSWLGDRKLQWNEQKLRLELDKQQIDVVRLFDQFSLGVNKDFPKMTFIDVAVSFAKDNGYHPVRDYLSNLPSADELVLDKLYNAMGLTVEIQKKQLRKWLIAAVARVFNPGCKVDNVLILKSTTQGLHKTSFFETLFGDFFQTAGSHGKEADEILALHQAWCSEYGEIESTFDKKGLAILKAFLTKRSDTFRAPYAAASETLLRDFIFCGTTNEETFLADVSGNRRYWVIDIERKIDLKLIKSIRDEVWSAVVKIYLDGIVDGEPVDYLWWFDDAEDLEVAANTAKSEQVDEWEYEVMNLLLIHEWLTVREICLINNYPSNRSTDMRVAKILTQNKVPRFKDCVRVNYMKDKKKGNYYRRDDYVKSEVTIDTSVNNF